MNRKWLIPGIIVGIVAILGMVIIGGYNGLVGQREKINNALANVDTQYQRRSDLVKNLVATVKGASNFEQETLTQVTEARARATSINIDPSNATPEQLAQYQQSQGELGQALGRLLMVTENYPELKSVANFQDLQVQLEGTENRIAVARQDYNTTVTTYNTTISRFPTNITAGIFGFDRYATFKADQGAEDAPTVDFNS